MPSTAHARYGPSLYGCLDATAHDSCTEVRWLAQDRLLMPQ